MKIINSKNFLTPDYSNRKERNEYVIDLINNHFSETKTILNIGGGQKRYFKDTKYVVTEIDKDGDNDFTIDLDKIKRLSFEDNTFDIALALDVLEHLENFHLILDEIIRVSKKNVIISLPNSLLDVFSILLDKRQNDKINQGVYSKFYGLPLIKPIDRHRWFLTVSDIERFFKNYSIKNKFTYEIVSPLNKSFKSKLLGFFLNDRLKKELLTKYCWVFIEKQY